MIELLDISKKFQSDFWKNYFWVLRNLSLKIPPGEIVGLLGANGAGKTTLIKIIMGLISPTSGQVMFDQELGKTKKEIMGNIGLLPERPYFWPSLSGRELIFYLGGLNDVPKTRIIDQLNYWSKRLSLEGSLDRKIKTYSKGMIQRIGLISTLIHDPKLIILDEPLSGLDPLGRKELKDIILEVNKEGRTIFFSSHIVPDVEEICKRVIFLDQTELTYNGPIDTLISESLRPNYLIRFHYTGDFEYSEGVIKKEVTGEKDHFCYEIKYDEKDTFLKKLFDLNVTIESVEKTKTTLEQVLYKVRAI